MTLVETRAGTVRGVDLGDVLVWQGIPYAAPPVGKLRLRPPQPPAPWQGVREATAPGNAAMQSVLPGLPAPAMDEDCLYANVAAPPPDGRLRPVLVWIHGGGYLTGSGTDMYGDGALFARTHDLVVVSFNYRLGSLGFLDIGDSSGVSGLLDQVQALRWVRENIAAFGGDPKRVTLYGLSAGAKSVANLLATPLTRGLIHRAASSSGGGDHVATPAQAKAVTVRFLRELGVSADRVREVPAAEMLAAQDAIATGAKALWIWRPVIDGTVLSGRPIDAIAAGAAAGIPLLAQTCGNEGGTFQMLDASTAAQAPRVLAELFGTAEADTILAAYRESRPELDDTALGLAVLSDERYGIPTTRLAEAQARHAPVWRSCYDGPFPGVPATTPLGRLLRGGHSADGPMIWQSTPLTEPADRALSAELHDTWGHFARGAAPSWAPYDTEHRQTMIFDAGQSRVEPDPRPLERRAWNGRTWPSGTWWHLDGLT
ncbi:carboxylesterase/lipase family protein [Nonomuraea sp. NPDC049028]|uniref:carboxylesterase/lipase family protein n=1 Tax=Nonomuraea sp. NPDC049028 TaxID=3364348 RepID=UPI0037122097